MAFSTVLVTGSNRGIGLEFVKQLVALPSPPTKLFATCRNPDKADELQKIAQANSSVKVLKLDIKDVSSFSGLRGQVEKELGKKGGLNLLINNAGIAIRDELGEISKDNMIENFSVNTVSPLLLAQEFLPLLLNAAKAADGPLSCSRAAIVNITSKMGSIDDNGSGGCYPYRASKAALNMVTKSLAMDLKSKGVLAICLHPGWVVTDMGGPNGLIDTKTSVEGMLKVICNASEKQNGLMIEYNGKTIPW